MSLPLSSRTWYGANVPGGKLDCLRETTHALRQRLPCLRDAQAVAKGLWSAGRSAPVELLDDGAGLPAAAVALHARAHLEPQRGGGDVSLLDVHTARRERSAKRAAHVGPAGVGVRRLECVGCSTSCETRLARPRPGSQGGGGGLRLGAAAVQASQGAVRLAQGALRWASACGCLAVQRWVSCLLRRRAPPQRATK